MTGEPVQEDHGFTRSTEAPDRESKVALRTIRHWSSLRTSATLGGAIRSGPGRQEPGIISQIRWFACSQALATSAGCSFFGPVTSS